MRQVTPRVEAVRRGERRLAPGQRIGIEGSNGWDVRATVVEDDGGPFTLDVDVSIDGYRTKMRQIVQRHRLLFILLAP
jgi:hypothetical protein